MHLRTVCNSLLSYACLYLVVFNPHLVEGHSLFDLCTTTLTFTLGGNRAAVQGLPIGTF